MARSALREIIQSIHRRNPSISEPEKTPETPGTPYALNGDDPFSVELLAESEFTFGDDGETPTSELLRKCRIARMESTMAKREKLKACFSVFDEKDILLFKERCRMQNVKDVAYTVTSLLQKIDAKYPNKFELKSEEKQSLNDVLAEMVSIQMQYMEVQNYPETRVQCYATYVMQQSPVGSKEVPFINGFNSILELFIPYIQKDALNANSAIKFFSGMLSNTSLNTDTHSIVVLMAMILENNDLAAPILILQLLKIAVVLGSVEFIAGLLEGLERTTPDRQGYVDAIKELHGDVRVPDGVELETASIKILIMYNCDLLHLAARVSSLMSLKCLMNLGADVTWPNVQGIVALRYVGVINSDDYFHRNTLNKDPEHEQRMERECRLFLLRATPEAKRQTLEQIAIENLDDACQLIEAYFELGANPLKPNAQRLFPFHYAQSTEVFQTLTKPPLEPRSLLLLLARSNISELDKINFVRLYLQKSIPLDVLFRDPESNSSIGIAAARKEDRLAEVFGETLRHTETQFLEENKIKKLERELRTSKQKNQHVQFEHKERMLRLQADYAERLRNEMKKYKAELDLKDQLLVETRAQADAMKEYNQLILSEVDKKEKAIQEVADQSNRIEETVELMKKAKEETTINAERMEAHRHEVNKLREQLHTEENNFKKQIDTKKFLIDTLKQERQKLQVKNKDLEKKLKDQSSKMQSKILTLEEENAKISKENKQKKLASQQTKALAELNKSRDELIKRKKENEEQKKDFEQKMLEMGKVVEQLKGRVQHLETTIKKNEEDYRKSLGEQREQVAAKEKEISILKAEVQQFNAAVQLNKDNDNLKSGEIQKEIDSYKDKLESAQIELSKMKQNYQTQDLTFRVIQERLVFTTNEAERYKALAQKKVSQLSNFCSSFLREASADFEIENDFEKSVDVLETEKVKKELEVELDALRNENTSLSKKIDAIVTCPICEEKFEASGERIPSKLKCTHIVCHQCALGWLQAKGTKASCPQCRTLYRQSDIKPVNLNCEL